MIKKRYLAISISLVFSILACGGGTTITPTEQATQSSVQEQPTDAEAATEPAATQAIATTESPATQTVPGLETASGWFVYTNANRVSEVALLDDTLYAAGTGGMVAWNTADGSYVKYTTLDGMSYVGAYAITACNMPEPRIVVGLEKGIDMFDPATGTWEAATFAPEDSGLDKNTVRALYCDQANHRLIIGYSGVGIYNFDTGEYTHYTTDNGLAWNGVSDVTVQGQDVWVAAGYNSVAAIRGDQVTVYNEAGGMPDETAYALAPAPDGTVWIGTSSGLVRFRGGQWTLYDTQNGNVPGSISALSVADDGKIWLSSYLGGTGRVCEFDPAAETCNVVIENANGGVSDFVRQPDGKLFAGTDSGITMLANGSQSELVIAADQLRSNFVDSLAIDSNGLLWAGSDAGIHRFDPAAPDSPWEVFTRSNDGNGPAGNWASHLNPADDGTMWAVITNGILSSYSGDQWTVHEGFGSVSITEIDSEGRVWVADDDKPIAILENGAKTGELSAADGVPGGNVKALLADGDTMWIGAIQGLARYTNGAIEQVFAKSDPALHNYGIIGLAKDVNGDLLIATSGALIRYDGIEAVTLLKGESGSNIFDGLSSISSVAVGQNGELYVGTYTGLVSSLDGGASWSRFSTENGLTSNNINIVMVDQYNTLWLGGGYTNGGGGLMRYRP